MSALLGYLAIAFIKLLGLIPFRAAQRFGGWLGNQLYKRNGKMVQAARINIRMTLPELTAEQQEHLVRESLRESAKSIVEMGVMWGASPEKGRSLVRKVHNLEYFTDAIKAGKGLVFMVPHLGNWEVLNHFATLHTGVTAMYRPAKNKVLDTWMRESRQKTGGYLVPTSRAGVAELFRALQEGKLAGLLPDQEPKRPSGVFVPFMGVETLTPKLPHELIARTGAAAVFGFAKRLPNAEGFEVYFVKPEDEIYSDDVHISTAALNRAIETCVRMCPEQYQWTYKRFRRRPDENENPYKKVK